MPTTTVKKSDGSSAGDVSLSESIFAAKVNTGLMYQAVQTERTNSRQDTRSTKTRAAVAGGGRKPYRQKGTGRARQGSITAPHYRHGGIVFGPHPRDLSLKMTKKARRGAILSALTAKANDEQIIILDSLAIETPSTRQAAALLKSLGIAGSVLVVLPEMNLTIHKSFRNIPGAQVRVAPQFSVQDILGAERVLIVHGALERLDSVWGDQQAQTAAEESAE
jgi:large subunit ribosomal protein L4